MESSKLDSELHSKMADLDIMEIGESSSKSNEPEPTTRMLRKRKQLTSEVNKSTNRRVSMKPRKHNVITENANSKQIEALYLNKKVRNISQTLETIYEEPKPSHSDTNNLISGRKVKRLLTFQLGNHYTKDKIRRRRAKIKKLLNKSFLNRKKIPMNVFLQTIECLELDDVAHIESKTLESAPL